MNLKTIFKRIYELKINDVFVEAGGIFFTDLFNSNLVDELHLFKSQKIIGYKGRPFIINKKINDLSTQEISRIKFGNDIYQHLKFI